MLTCRSYLGINSHARKCVQDPDDNATDADRQINEERDAVGKGPVGFINPVLYSHAGINALHDVVNGSNPNCNSSGFPAVPGWDPSTGKSWIRWKASIMAYCPLH
jgi:hypothetical protein